MHDGGVIEDLTGGLPDALQRGEVGGDELGGDGWVDGVDGVNDGLDLAEGAAHEDELGWVAVGKRHGGFCADAAITWAGDQDYVRNEALVMKLSEEPAGWDLHVRPETWS